MLFEIPSRGYILIGQRRGGRVVEGAALEMLCTGNGTVGSNPTLSAIFCAQKMANEAALVRRLGLRLVIRSAVWHAKGSACRAKAEALAKEE